MTSEVLDFLTKVATEPNLYAAFLNDATAVMQREGLEPNAQKALTSGDPLRVHAAIKGQAAVNEEAYEKSLQNARTVMDVLRADPTVAQWLYGYYAQMMWGGAPQPPRAGNGLSTPHEKALHPPAPANLNNG